MSVNIPLLKLTKHRLAKYIKSIRKGQTAEQEDEEQLMLDLVEKYNTFDNQQRTTHMEQNCSKVKQEVLVRIPFPTRIYCSRLFE